ncbi:MAG: acetamidase/formamidase family protein [SAR324 cluster bacterium]|nr:acetamidase/formamidase family protein [SAR324 cluster bacterium]MCZ6645204.1 acetamidase/formamidase family protein [SAR324 cluster bacterium]MCZ6843265.1 acetamidase/formamidase family protein [SAR324 cluster bacterium]
MTTHITMDRTRPLREQPGKGHNRWHPDIPAVATVRPGELVTLDTLDALDGQITPDTTPADLGAVERRVAHALTGPLYVEGAMPGDLLAVHIEAIDPQPFGFTANFNDFGFLRDIFTEPGLLRWTIEDGFATSPDLTGVRIPGAPFMGVMGVAPSHELFERILAREEALAARGGRTVPPTIHGAVPAEEPIAGSGLRTAPPRENGGNVDIRQTTSGTTVYMPVYVPGALFSTGDAHFTQGDGEVCGTAIEMGATLTARFEVIKDGAGNQQDMSFERREYFAPPEIAVPRRFFATTGICVHKDGRAESEDLTLAARNAVLNMLEHIERSYGFSRQQAYLLSSVAVDLKISQVVDLPNVLVSAFLPLDIFEG